MNEARDEDQISAPSEAGKRDGGVSEIRKNSDFGRLLDSALLIAITTGLMFYWGYSYYNGYYERLSYGQPLPLDSAPRYVLKTATVLLGGMYIVFNSSPYLKHIHPNPKSRSEALNANGFVLVALLGLLIWSATNFFDWFLVIFLSVILASVIGFTLLKLAVLHLWDRDGRTANLIILIGLGILLGQLVFSTQGRVEATKLIEGSWEHGSTISFEMRDYLSPFDGERFALVEHRDGDYYVTEIANPAPKKPKLFIVPDSEIRSATIERMDGGAEPKIRATPLAESSDVIRLGPWLAPPIEQYDVTGEIN